MLKFFSGLILGLLPYYVLVTLKWGWHFVWWKGLHRINGLRTELASISTRQRIDLVQYSKERMISEDFDQIYKLPVVVLPDVESN